MSVSLTGLITGGGWWIASVLIGSLVLATGAALRLLGARAVLVHSVQTLVLAVTVIWVFAAPTAILGVVPTSRTIGAFARLASEAMADIRRDSIPAPAATALLLLIVAGTGALTIVLDTLATSLRRPAAGGVVFVVALSVPAVIIGEGVWAIAVCAFAYLYLLRCGERALRHSASRPGPSFAIGAGALLVALVVSATLPLPGVRHASTPGVDPHAPTSVTVSPLVQLGKDLREPKTVDVLDYTSTSPQPPYLKLMTLDDFSGSAWTRTEGSVRSLAGSGRLGPAAGLSPSVPVTRVTTRIRIDSLVSDFLPAPSIVARVSDLPASWSWSPSDLTVESSTSSTTRGLSYAVESTEIDPTVRELDDAGGAVPASVRSALTLPSHVPAVITQTARTATAGDTTQYQEALDLQDYFRENGFTYSTTTPLKEGYDGAGLDVIAKFLSVKAGYCVHFASAMAIMARTLGIPADIDVGYVPGDLIRTTGDGRYEFRVSSNDLHAWPVLYLKGLGWVSFEPTLGTDTVPAYSAPSAHGIVQAAASADSGAARAAPQQRAPSAQSTRARARSSAGRASVLAQVSRSIAAWVSILLVWMALAAAAVAVLLGVWVALRRRHRRARRLGTRRRRGSVESRAGSGVVRVRELWDELRDTAVDLGWAAPPGESPRHLAERLGRELSGVSSELDRLRGAVERERFGPPSAEQLPWPSAGISLTADAVTVLHALAAGSTARERLRAGAMPHSEWMRITGRLRRQGSQVLAA